MAQEESGNSMSEPVNTVLNCSSCKKDYPVEVMKRPTPRDQFCPKCAKELEATYNAVHGVNTVSIGDNKPIRSGFHQTLCADCKTPTPLSEMWPIGAEKRLTCSNCILAKVFPNDPILADIAD